MPAISYELVAHSSQLICLFCPQRFRRIRKRRPDRLKTYGDQCNGYGQRNNQNKGWPANTDLVIIVFQPLIHRIPGNWNGNDTGNQNQDDKIF